MAQETGALQENQITEDRLPRIKRLNALALQGFPDYLRIRGVSKPGQLLDLL